MGHLQYFLGANSADGFVSLYDGLRQEGEFLWILKGGPGCGKSTFLRYVAAAAERAGYEAERVLCSGDPDSLDAIRIPALRCCFADGTAPHVLEPDIPGASSLYIDLGRFCNTDGLRAKESELRSLLLRYRSLYAKAYRLLSAADNCMRVIEAEPALIPLRNHARERAVSFAARHLPRHGGDGGERELFLSAVCYLGRLRLNDTAEQLCNTLYYIENDLGLAEAYLGTLHAEAAARGLRVIRCPDPIRPDKTEALLLPELSLGFIVTRRGESEVQKQHRHIRLDSSPAAAALRADSRYLLRHAQELTADAVSALADAKAMHDELEQLYHPHVDFDAVLREAEAYAARILHKTRGSAYTETE